MMVVLSGAVFGQDYPSVERIKRDKSYQWGEGAGSSLEEADREALQNLVQQISVSVVSSYEQEEAQMGLNDQTVSREDIAAKLKTFSFATLQNVEQVILSEEPARVFRYVKRSEIEKSFQLRRERALSLVEEANRALEKVQLGDALKYYYWAMALLNATPQGASYKASVDGQEVLLYTWCYGQIERIVEQVEFKVTRIEAFPSYHAVRFDVRYGGVPVSNLDYQYWIGQRYSALHSVHDGVGTADLMQLADGDQLKLKIEYQYASMAKNLDAELRGCFEGNLPNVPLNSVQKHIPISLKEVKTIQKEEQKAQKLIAKSEEAAVAATQADLRVSAYARNQEMPYSPVSFASPASSESYKAVMTQVEQAIRQKSYESVMNLFTPDGWDMFNKIVAYGKATILAEPNYQFICYGDEVICRSIPMQFKFRHNKVFVQNVTFRFDKQGRIDSIAFTLPDSMEALLFDSGFRWDNNSRLLMMSFLENYQTAYSLKRYEYIESIYHDEALIIVGKVLKSAGTRPMDSALNGSQLFSDPEVQLQRRTKEQYMAQLKRSFNSNEYINIAFEDIDIAKMVNSGEIYAIHLKQYYYSTNYSDTGYLTLLVDLRDSTAPMIHVRVWNPKKDPNFTARKFLQRGAELFE